MENSEDCAKNPCSIIFEKKDEGKALIKVLEAGLETNKFRKNSKAYKIAQHITKDLVTY